MYSSDRLSVKQVMDLGEKYLASKKKAKEVHITFTDERTIIHASDKDKVFIPSATAKRFIESSGFVDLVMGPYGSGKSTMCVQRIVRSVSRMPKWYKGKRRARWAIVRNTSGELQSTTLQTWLNWFENLGEVYHRQKPIMTYEHTFNDGHGEIELELIFIALDRPDDVRKIKSLELTGVYLNELSELPQNVLSHFKGRVNGRYPSRSFCDVPHWSGIIADTNPPDEDHWIYRDFEVKPSKDYTVFHQPSGLLEDEYGVLIKDKDGLYIQNPLADNAENMASDYYPKLSGNETEGFIKVYCCGKYGLVESGKRVYPEYGDDLHSVPSIEAIQGDPIYLGWDFGLTPACVVVQISPRGQVRVLKEYIAEDMGIRTFAKNIVIPRLAIDFVYNKVGGSEGDPAGAKGDEIMEELSCIGELNSLGITTNPASTNDPSVRISSVRYFLSNLIDHKPSLLVSREGCPTLRKGFVSGYHYKRVQINDDERYQDKPNKNKYSHVHDALQYCLMRFAADRVIERKVEDKSKIDMYNPVLRIF